MSYCPCKLSQNCGSTPNAKPRRTARGSKVATDFVEDHLKAKPEHLQHHALQHSLVYVAEVPVGCNALRK